MNFNGEKKKYLLSAIGLIFFIIVSFRELLSPSIILNATDTLTQDYFWYVFFKANLFNPSELLWIPYIDSGATFHNILHLFAPITLLSSAIFPPNLAITITGLSHLFLAGFFTLLYARLIGLRWMASFLAAVFFVFSTQIVSLFNAGHIGKLNTISIFPLVLFTLEKALQKKRLIDFAFVSLALAFQFYEGHIQVVFYTCIVVGIYFISRSVGVYKDEKNLRIVGRLYSYAIIMTIIFFSLSSIVISQWVEFKGQSERSEGSSYEFATSWSMPTEELATYIIPEFFGLSRANYNDPGKIKVFYWGEMPFTQTSDYLGLIPLILMAVALIKCRTSYVRLFLFLGIIFQILAMGKYTPIYPFFYNYLGFKFFRVPKMNLFIVAFAVSMMAAYGAQWLFGEMSERDRRFYKWMIYAVLGIAGVVAILALYGNMNENNLARYFYSDLKGSGRSFNPSLIIVRYENAIRSMWIASIFLAACAGVLAVRFTGNVRVFFVLLLGFFIFDTSMINSKFIDATPVKGNDFISKDPAVRYFERDKGTYRVLNAIMDIENPILQKYRVPNKYIAYKIHTAVGYEAVQTTRYTDFIDSLTLEGNIIDLLNVKYVVMDKNAVAGTVGDMVGKYTIVLDEDVKILRNENVLPRAFPVHQAKIVDRKQVLFWLNNPAFDPRKAVLLEKPTREPLSPQPLPETESQVHISSYKNTEIRMDAMMSDNGFVVLSEKSYPGWKAYLDGKPVELYMADCTLKAVYVPKGSHRVIVRYEPDNLKYGVYVTFAALLLVGGIMVNHKVLVNRGRA